MLREGGQDIEATPRVGWDCYLINSPNATSHVALSSCRLILLLNVQHVKLDRQVLEAAAGAAKRAQADGEPLSYVNMMVDGANQTAYALPTCWPWTHGTDRWAAKCQRAMTTDFCGLARAVLESRPL